MPLRDWFFGLFGRAARTEEGGIRARGQATHIILLDGTMSSLKAGYETNAGLTYKLLTEASRDANLTVYYEAGIQWRDWATTWDVMTGRGINRQIKRAYGALASRYKPGDQIMLIGYSRGAFAVRSLAGVIDMVGLLKQECATNRAIRQAYRLYRARVSSPHLAAFRAEHCYAETQVEAVAVWDTVKALGLRVPLIWRWVKSGHEFHSHALGPSVQYGFHALALDESRPPYRPILWDSTPEWNGKMEQVWFRGNHADVGGQVGLFPAARPLANIPLVWMLSRLEHCGLPLPDGWKGRFEQDVTAPSMGNWSGWAKLFLYRRKRIVGRDVSERVHESVAVKAN